MSIFRDLHAPGRTFILITRAAKVAAEAPRILIAEAF
jgi:hypothetical protein